MNKVKFKTLKLFSKIAKCLEPPEKLRISDWANKFRILSKEASAEPGHYSTDRAPYQKEMMDAVSDDRNNKVIFMTSSQIGKTEILNNIIGFFIDHDPSPLMMLMPTVDLCKSYSKKRLAPMIRDTPQLRGKVNDAKSRDSDNTILEKGFAGGYIVMVGANSPTNLSSRPIRVLLADEVDRFPASAGVEGDPLDLAEKRTSTFWNRKLVYVSTPTEKHISRIEKEYEQSTMGVFEVPCPCCGTFQTFKWSQIKFESVTMECMYCHEEMNETEWKEHLPKGKWTHRNPESSIVGFHLNALYSPWERWDTIIDKFKEAKKKGKENLKVWINTYLGESWEDDEGEKMESADLFKRRIAYDAQVPEGVLVLTAAVDVQDDRLEVEVVGWGVEKKSWGIEYTMIPGKLDTQDPWNQLDEYLSRAFSYKDESKAYISCTCVDSGGHYTTEVYKFCKKREHRRIYAIKGFGGPGRPFIGRPSRNNNEKALLIPLGVDSGKETLFSRINEQFDDEPGYCNFPIDRGYDRQYFEGLTSERRVVKYKKGKMTISWEKKKSGARNEPFDLRNYATAALEILNPDFEKLEKEKEEGIKTEKLYQSPQKKKRRGVVNKGVSF